MNFSDTPYVFGASIFYVFRLVNETGFVVISVGKLSRLNETVSNASSPFIYNVIFCLIVMVNYGNFRWV